MEVAVDHLLEGPNGDPVDRAIVRPLFLRLAYGPPRS